MSAVLLDTNLLIALLWPAHAQHEAAVEWFARRRAKGWATSPMTEAGFVRIVSNPAFSRDAVAPREALEVLRANTAAKDHRFWPDELPVAEAVSFAGVRLVGHQQLTDAYLFGLAVNKGGTLATFNQSILSLLQPDSPHREALELLQV